jgi:hypothetical protein
LSDAAPASALRQAARAVQLRLEDFYGLHRGPDVGDFVQRAEGDSRETLLVRERDDTVEVTLVLPEASARSAPEVELDDRLQLIEGVSHFVYLVERARIERPITELELELQAEVDKFVLLAFDGQALSEHRATALRTTLYDRVMYLHTPESERGQRYRLANELARRFSLRLAARGLEKDDVRRFARRFYDAGQADKIRLAS